MAIRKQIIKLIRELEDEDPFEFWDRLQDIFKEITKDWLVYSIVRFAYDTACLRWSEEDVIAAFQSISEEELYGKKLNPQTQEEIDNLCRSGAQLCHVCTRFDCGDCTNPDKPEEMKKD